LPAIASGNNFAEKIVGYQDAEVMCMRDSAKAPVKYNQNDINFDKFSFRLQQQPRHAIEEARGTRLKDTPVDQLYLS
jgi:hypothetical protein